MFLTCETTPATDPTKLSNLSVVLFVSNKK